MQDSATTPPSPPDGSTTSRGYEDVQSSRNRLVSPPTSISGAGGVDSMRLRRRRHLSLFDSIALVLGLQIGSGIFASPAVVARKAGSVPAALLVWTAAGALTWAFAACYTELAMRMPYNGGPQEYLASCFSDSLGFLASWLIVFAVKPCSAAVLALVIAEYLCDAGGIDHARKDFAIRLVASATVAVVAVVNCIGNRLSSFATKAMLLCKILGIGFVITAGFAYLVAHTASIPGASRGIEHFPRQSLGAYTDAILAAMWAYSGWETLSFVAGEMRDPHRTFPLMLTCSMTVTLVLFLLANISYFSVLSFAEAASSNTIGLTFSRRFLPHAAEALYAAMICLSSFGSLNVKVFTAGRLTQAASERNYLPAFLTTVEKARERPSEAEHLLSGLALLQQPVRYGDGSIPLSAILFNALLAVVYVFVADFVLLIIFTGIVEYLVAFGAILGLLVIRLRLETVENADPIYTPWLVIITALATNAVIISISLAEHPVAGLGLAGFCAASVGIKALIARNERPLHLQ